MPWEYFLDNTVKMGNIENSLLLDFVQKVQLCAQKKKKFIIIYELNVWQLKFLSLRQTYHCGSQITLSRVFGFGVT